MNIDKKKTIIRTLLSGRLTQSQRKEFADLEPVDLELRKQWEETADKATIDASIKEQIWERVKVKCEHKKSKKALTTQMWYFAAASLALLLTIGGFWFQSAKSRLNEEFTTIIAQQSETHVLPDSTKIWMEAGSSIRYAKEFKGNREVWLKGNSLFDVTKNETNKFRVHINNAFIEVKGTCFEVRQNSLAQNEITLYNGSIDFNIEQTGEVMELHPLQKIQYNVEKAEAQIENIENIHCKNGKFYFDNMPLPQLIQAINRMYHTNIQLKNDKNIQSAFNGSIRFAEPLNDVLTKICFSLDLSYEYNESIIYIY